MIGVWSDGDRDNCTNGAVVQILNNGCGGIGVEGEGSSGGVVSAIPVIGVCD